MRRSKAILDALDGAGDAFPALVTFSWRYGGGRLHAFADAAHWAIVIEAVTYGYSARDVNSFALVLHCFGDKLPARNRKPIWLAPVKRGPCGVLCIDVADEDSSFHSQRLHPEACDLKIRNRVVPIGQDRAAYRKLGIRLHHAPQILKAEFLPYLVETYRDELFATDREIGIKLPRLLTLDNWFHPDTLAGERPSHSRSFQQIASAIEHLDPKRYTLKRGNARWNQRPED